MDELDRRDKKGDVLSDLITMNKKTDNFSGKGVVQGVALGASALYLTYISSRDVASPNGNFIFHSGLGLPFLTIHPAAKGQIRSKWYHLDYGVGT